MSKKDMLHTFNGMMKEITNKTKTHSYINESPDHIGDVVISKKWQPYLTKVRISGGGFASYMHSKKTIDQMFFFHRSVLDLAMSNVLNARGQTFLYFLCRFASDFATDLLLQLHMDGELLYGQINDIQCANTDTPQMGSMWGCKQKEGAMDDERCRLTTVLWVLGADFSDETIRKASCDYLPTQPLCNSETPYILGFINDNISKYINVEKVPLLGKVPLLEKVPDVFEISFVDVIEDTFVQITQELKAVYDASLKEVSRQKKNTLSQFL